MRNIEPEDRRITISISVHAKSLKRIDEFINGSRNMSRSEFFETVSERHIDNIGNSDKNNLFSDKQIRSYFENLERYVKLSSMDVRHRILPIVEHANNLTSALTRTVKVDISKITEGDPLERIRLDGLRSGNKYHDAHEVASTEIELTSEYVSKCKAAFKAKARFESRTNPNSQKEAEIELEKLIGDATKINKPSRHHKKKVQRLKIKTNGNGKGKGKSRVKAKVQTKPLKVRLGTLKN